MKIKDINQGIQIAQDCGIEYSVHRGFPAQKFSTMSGRYVSPQRALYLKRNGKTVREIGRIVRFANVREIIAFMRGDLQIAARSV